jgi:hypothetical protein
MSPFVRRRDIIILILIGQLWNIFKSKQPRSSSVFGCSVNWPDWNVTIIFWFFPKMFEMTIKKVFHAHDKYVLRLLNVVIHEHQFKRKGKYYKFHFDKRCTRSQKTPGSLCSKLEVFIWRHVVYVPKSSTTFREILICVIFRPSDMQEYYMLFGIFARDVGLYSLSVFYIAWSDFQYTNVYLFCVLQYLSLCTFYRGVSWNSHL